MKTRVTVVMPAWNEAEGLPGFITELNKSLINWSPSFIVVDDCSTDGTVSAAMSLTQVGISIYVYKNDRNLGHGPSTVEALNRGLATEADYVIAIDGDGQFIGDDVGVVLKTLEDLKMDVVEGVRTNRADPPYRRLVSLTTKMLVAMRARSLPADANTPLRAYRSETLAGILSALPVQSATPNLIISVLCRRWRLNIAEIPVRSIPRRGSDPEGITWGKARKNVPSKGFIIFCVKAVREWATTSVSRNSETGIT